MTVDEGPEPIVRPEEPRDREAVRRLNEAAFGGTTEADIVEALHAVNEAVVALVAELEHRVIGHILFSRVSLEPAIRQPMLALGPMAVDPAFQRRGIGTLLVRDGLNGCRDSGASAVVVVGHPDYYPRFGFEPAARHGLRCEYDVPADVFMAVELLPGSLRHVSGLVRYHRAFSEA